LLLLTLLAVFSAGALAAQQKPYAEIPVHKQSGIDYVSGGMTDDERKELGRISNKYPMQLVFIAGENTEPIRGVKVTVRDIKGSPLIEAVADGPYFFFNPPSGRWTMDAEYGGEVVSRRVDLIGRRYILLEFKFKFEGE
jgi:hypothetical protein